MDNPHSATEALNIITLNCWGLKYLSKLRKERLEEIGKRLARASPVPHIVGLQECWTSEDYLKIRSFTRSILPYGKFYHSGIFGGGLAILSKWPIEESNMLRYPLNGRPTAFFRGDWFVGKGIACARIRTGPRAKDVVEVFCTHLHAPYEKEPHDSYICHRTAQAWEIAKLMRGAVERGHLVIGLGDFNMIPLSLAHRLITAHAPVMDVWRVLHPDSSLGASVDTEEKARGRSAPDVIFNLMENGATCDSVLNTWRWTKDDQKALFKGKHIKIDDHSVDLEARRLDYIFVGYDSHSNNSWRIQEAKVGMTDRHSLIGCSLTDHFSVEATITRAGVHLETSHEGTAGPGAFSKELGQEIVSEDISQSVGTRSLPPSTYEEILEMISLYTLRERRQRRLRLLHFSISILIFIGCSVAIVWSPHNYVSFILLFTSTIGFGAGILDGLIGGLFVGSELRALKEFEWEIVNALSTAKGTRSEEERSLRDWFD
ncbi:MAG: phospholipase C type enzyme [Icmadophila ericetorum]|nr:phospholipase C type enzyme [Icmadophila ericetorum]